MEKMQKIGFDMKCSCGGIFVHYMNVETPNQKYTTAVYECNICHQAFER